MCGIVGKHSFKIHKSKAYFQPFLEAILSIGPAILIASLLLAMTLYSLNGFANPLIDISLNDELDCFVPRNEVYDF
jgi:hypothetical protein